MRFLTEEDEEALAVLARNHRILVIIIPVGVPEDAVKELSKDVNARLDALVVARGPMQ